MKKIVSRNPFTGTINREFDFLTNQQVDQAIDKAVQAFKVQTARTSKEKIYLLESLANRLENSVDKFATLISTEMGKPITQSRGEVRKVVNHARYYAKNLDFFQNPTLIPQQAKKKTLVKYRPLGIIYYIVPFNFPFWLTFKGGLGNLVLGNCLLLRPSPLSPILAEATQELMEQAGFDSGEFQTVQTTHDQLDQIMANKHVVGVNFTGSSKSGASIAQVAGKHIKKSVMELGGNDPFIVLEDADIDEAVKGAVRGRCANAGQVCFSPKRFIAVGKAYETFKAKLLEALSKVVVGDPLDEKTEMGPLCSPEAHANLQKQLQSLPKSWRLLYKASVPAPFFPIHVFEANAEEPFLEELFGPIFSLFKARDDSHAVQIANQGDYGLSSTCYSGDSQRAERLLDQVRAGMAFINEVPKSDTNLPTGGVANSGYGRECGIDGFREFANVKLYYVN